MFGRRAPGEVDARLTLLAQRVAEIDHKLSTVSSTALLVRINELEAALEQLQKSNRREFGKLWKLAWGDKAPADRHNGGREDLDPELQAFLDLQRAHGSD